MGPLRGDGNTYLFSDVADDHIVEKMGPLRGDGNFVRILARFQCVSREDGSPSWGRKPSAPNCFIMALSVEKMGPLRGDGNPFLFMWC